MDTRIFDLHCDTLSAMRADPSLTFRHMPLHVDLEKLKQGGYLLQCMACFVNLGEEKDPLTACLEMIDLFDRLTQAYPGELMPVKSAADIDTLSKTGKTGLMLTVEEGGVCLGNLAVLRTLYRLGVRMMTLTWNYENGIGYPNNPCDTDGMGGSGAASAGGPQLEKGLTKFGFDLVEEMERLHMIVDVSHLSDKGIWDVLGAAKRPFAASHSNARAVTWHVRNLTDEMIRRMGGKGCLIGLNFCPAFVQTDRGGQTSQGGQPVSRVEDLVRHAQHLIRVGGEDILALGSDFDGIGGPLEIDSAAKMPLLVHSFEKNGFTARQIEKITHENAVRFFRENL